MVFTRTHAPPSKTPSSQAVNLATAQRVLASGALEPDNAAASDLGILKIVVDGCPGRAPTAALDAPRLVIVQEHAWAMEGAAAPSTLLVRPGPGAASANITIKVGLPRRCSRGAALSVCCFQFQIATACFSISNCNSM
jgi:hypothetical protein